MRTRPPTRRAILHATVAAPAIAAILAATRRAEAAAFDVSDSGWEGGAELFQIAKTELGAERVKPVATLDWSALKPEDGLPTTLVIRADRETPFAQIFRMITACQTNGFRKFAMKAMSEGG